MMEESEITPSLRWDIPDAMLFPVQTINKTGAWCPPGCSGLRLRSTAKREDRGARHVDMEGQQELADNDMIAFTRCNQYSRGKVSFHSSKSREVIVIVFIALSLIYVHLFLSLSLYILLFK